MTDPNIDHFYNTPYADYFMNILNNLNPRLTHENNDVIGIGSSQVPELWNFQNNPDLLYSPLNSFGFNGETSTRIETNLGNEIQEPALLPFPSTIESRDLQYSPLNPFGINGGTGKEIQELILLPSSNNGATDVDNLLMDLFLENPRPDPSMIKWRMSNQSETNLGNEIDEPFSFPSLMPPVLGFICNEKTNNQTRTDLVPSLQVQFDCHFCEILREIVHIDGRNVMKLEIHGRFPGFLFHAILDVQQSNGAVSREMFDFYDKSFEEVKQFLAQYCMKRKEEGYTMMKDPKSSFFEALTVGFDWYEKVANGAQPGGNGQVEAANNKNPISLAEKRKKVKETTIKDLSDYFLLTRREAAKKMGLSETAIHNIWCKGHGGVKKRWPFRKMQSKVKAIMKLKELLKSEDPRVRDGARDDIRRKEEELAKYYKEAKPNPRLLVTS